MVSQILSKKKQKTLKKKQETKIILDYVSCNCYANGKLYCYTNQMYLVVVQKNFR